MKKETASAIVVTLLIGSMLFSATSFVKGQTETHDLEVSLSSFSPSIINETYNHLSTGNSTVLNATVTNRGIVNESNVTLQLLINGNESLNATTATLGVNSTFWTAYYWSPADGDYNLTVYAPPMTGETNIANNNVTRWVRVCPSQPLIANFTFSPPPPPPGPLQYQSVTFDASNSSDPNRGGPTALTYTWNFGDNNITPPMSSPICTHSYAVSRNYNVTLTVRDTENLNGNTSQSITVYAQPVAIFTIDKPRPLPGPYYVNETLTLDASASKDPKNSTGPNNGIVSYTWYFNDGNITTVTDSNITHSYNNTGNYNVVLIVTDYVNLSGSTMVPLSVSLGNPVAIFTPPPQPCYVGQLLTFNASVSYDPKNSSAPNYGIVSYTWDFNDGNTTTVTNPTITHTYNDSKGYNVNLTVTDYEGLIGSINKTVTVSFQVFVMVVDNVTGTTDIVYNPGQEFKINITATNVVALDYFDFTLTYPGGNPPPLLKGEEIDPGDLNVLDDRSIRDLQGQIHVNSTAHIGGVSGSFTLAIVTFTVTNPGNCTLHIYYSLLNSTSSSIPHTRMDGHFYTTKPVADFNYSSNAVANMTAVIFDASASYDPDNLTAPNRGIVSYTWDFNDGNITTVSSPTVTHLYHNPENYTVNLTVTDYTSETWSINYAVEVVLVRDVGVIQVAPSKLQFNETSGLYETAGVLPITVTVTNEGNAIENFNVTLYFNNISIETENVTNLAPSDNYTIVFNHYKVKNVPKGVYNIIVNASQVPGETHTTDNTYTNGTVRVYLQGDINRDNKTDILDAIKLGNAMGSHPGDLNWNSSADLNGDGVVNVLDSIILGANFGAKDP